MPRLSLVALAAAVFCGVVAPSAVSSPQPLDTLSTGVGTSPRDVVSVGRYSFFTQHNSKIGRISEDGTVAQFPSGFTTTGRLTVGPEGTIWFLGSNGITGSKTVGRMTQDGQLLPQTQPMETWGTGLTTGADGNVWVAESLWVAKFAPNGSLLAEYSVQGGNGGFAHDVTAGPDGNIWVTESTLPGASAIGRITPSGVVTTFTGFIGPDCTPGSKPATCINTEHLAVGPDGNLWYTANKVYDGDVGSVGVLTTGGFAADQLLPAGALPTEIVGGPDQQMYVISSEAHTLLRIDLLGHVTATTPLGTYPSGLELGADGKLWVATSSSSAFQRVTPETRPSTGNLVSDGDGETGPRAALASATVPLAGWATSPGFTATTINAASGSGALWGGPNNASSYARQLVDVSSHRAAIDAGNRIATLSGMVGGFNNQDDHGTLTARFTDGAGHVLDHVWTDPVTAADRGGKTVYLPREAKRLIPKGTRYIEVELRASRVDGNSNDAFFDDVSLTLAALPAPAPGLGANPEQGGQANPATPQGQSTGTGGPSSTGSPSGPQGQDPESVTVLSIPTVPLAAFKPLATGGPFSTDPAETGGLFVGFTVSAATRLTVRVERKTAGRKSAKKCVAPAKAKRGAKTCTRYVAKGSFTVDLASGSKGLRLTGRLNGKRLPSGAYRLVMTPAGGKPVIVAMRVR